MFSYQSCFLLDVQTACSHCGVPYVPLNTVGLIGINTNTFPVLYPQFFCSRECFNDNKNGKITEHREFKEQWG